jgi:hypothetical protein
MRAPRGIGFNKRRDLAGMKLRSKGSATSGNFQAVKKGYKGSGARAGMLRVQKNYRNILGRSEQWQCSMVE